MGVKIKVKKLHAEAITPSYANLGDAGMDILSCEDSVILSGERKLISTGLSFEVPLGYEMQIRPKSGLALNHGLTIVNTPGTLDSGYRGELKVILFNTDKNSFEVKKGQKIAQAVINKVEEAHLEEVEELNESIRGKGGFGSTGLRIE